QGEIEVCRGTERPRRRREAGRRRAETDVRGKIVFALEANGTVDSCALAHVRDDRFDALATSPVDRLAVDDVAIVIERVVERYRGGGGARRGADADRIVIRKPKLGIAHAVILHESLDRMRPRSGF